LNEKYNRLLAQAKEGIAKIKALDENQEASGLCTEAMAGARAILELCQFEDQYLGMRQSPPEADRSDAP
jgi:hypothetical protein